MHALTVNMGSGVDTGVRVATSVGTVVAVTVSSRVGVEVGTSVSVAVGSRVGVTVDSTVGVAICSDSVGVNGAERASRSLVTLGAVDVAGGKTTGGRVGSGASFETEQPTAGMRTIKNKTIMLRFISLAFEKGLSNREYSTGDGRNKIAIFFDTSSLLQ